MYTLWDVSLAAAELTSTEEESQVLIIIETPDTVRTCRLEHVRQLDLSHEDEVPLENLIDRCLKIGLVINSHLIEAEEEGDEVELMSSSIVDSFV